MFGFLDSAPFLPLLLAAELLLLLVRSPELLILGKTDAQRTESERNQITNGLKRAVVFEFLIFVPASALLVYLTVHPFGFAGALATGMIPPEAVFRVAVHASFGLASYGFPFAALRAFVIRVALGSLKEFANLSQAQSAERRPESAEARLIQ